MSDTTPLSSATATPQTPADPITPSRDSLSFTRREPCGRINNWAMRHAPKDNWKDTVPRGRMFFAEVIELARHDPEEAMQAILWALTAPQFAAGWGEEHGFAECVARAAVSGVSAATPLIAACAGDTCVTASNKPNAYAPDTTNLRRLPISCLLIVVCELNSLEPDLDNAYEWADKALEHIGNLRFLQAFTRIGGAA